MICFNNDHTQNYEEVQQQLNRLVQKELPQGSYIESTKENKAECLNFSWFIRNKPDVLMSHGVADKDYYYIEDEDGKLYINSLKALLVPGEWMKKKLLRSKKVTLTEEQIIVCGWPRLDELRKLQADVEVSSTKEKIQLLWAPTHDKRKWGEEQKSTSSYPDFKVYAEELKKRYWLEESLHPRNRQDKKPTIDKLLEANVVVSDFGTMVYEAWALGKPVIFPRWILQDRVQMYIKYSAEAYIFENNIGYHPRSYEEMLSILDEGPIITEDVKVFMGEYLWNYKEANSALKIAQTLQFLEQKYTQSIIKGDTA